MEDQAETMISNDELFRILKLMEDSNWDRIELVAKDFKLIAGKSSPRDYELSSASPFRSPSSESEKAHTSKETKSENARADSGYQRKAKINHLPESEAEVNGTAIHAPVMGMFYRSPSPGAPPFVDVGDTITEHTIIGIIEVMKVMSSVEAGLKGRVSSILVESGQLVEYNQPLMLIESGE